MPLKPDAIGERLTENTIEPAPVKDQKLSLVKPSEESAFVEQNNSEAHEKDSQFTSILEFLKRKKAKLQTSFSPRSKRGIAFRKYQEALNQESRIRSALEPMIIDTSK